LDNEQPSDIDDDSLEENDEAEVRKYVGDTFPSEMLDVESSGDTGMEQAFMANVNVDMLLAGGKSNSVKELDASQAFGSIAVAKAMEILEQLVAQTVEKTKGFDSDASEAGANGVNPEAYKEVLECARDRETNDKDTEDMDQLEVIGETLIKGDAELDDNEGELRRGSEIPKEKSDVEFNKNGTGSKKSDTILQDTELLIDFIQITAEGQSPCYLSKEKVELTNLANLVKGLEDSTQLSDIPEEGDDFDDGRDAVAERTEYVQAISKCQEDTAEVNLIYILKENHEVETNDANMNGKEGGSSDVLDDQVDLPFSASTSGVPA
jgi:hypothetical protein